MKLISVAFVLVAVVFGTHEAQGQNGLGVGVIVGEPTGISVKNWMSSTRAIDAAAAWSFSGGESFQFHTDYLIHNFSFITLQDVEGRLPVYFGIGGRVKFRGSDDENGQGDDDIMLGMRIPFGISYLFDDAPVDLFLELVPVLDVVPDTDFDLNAAIGARFYFR